MASALPASIPEVTPIYNITVEIDTTPSGQNRTWKSLCAGFNNIQEALNEVVNQYFFLCGSGFACNYVTGMAPAYTLTGVRVLNDDAQTYIFGNSFKFGTMGTRETHMRLTRTEGASSTIISANVTLCNITDIGGGTTDGSACSVEIRINGAPVSGDDWAA